MKRSFLAQAIATALLAGLAPPIIAGKVRFRIIQHASHRDMERSRPPMNTHKKFSPHRTKRGRKR